MFIKNIEFRNVKNKFQSMLNKDIKRINSTNKVLNPADIFQNSHQIDKGDYKKSIRDLLQIKWKRSTANLRQLLKNWIELKNCKRPRLK